MIAIALEGETLDAVVWRVLGRTAGITEQAFDANPGVADLGGTLPGGTQIDLTLAAQAVSAPPKRDVVSLWD